jgi:hypothetical protein
MLPTSSGTSEWSKPASGLNSLGISGSTDGSHFLGEPRPTNTAERATYIPRRSPNIAVVIHAPSQPHSSLKPLNFDRPESRIETPSSNHSARTTNGAPAWSSNSAPQKRDRAFHDFVDPAPKKRRRPFKDPEAAEGELPRQNPKKRGRPLRTPDEVPDIDILEPKFFSFVCEWDGCRAELHNLNTLRAHILTVHNKKQPHGGLLCLWAKCSLKHEVETNPKRIEFKSKKEWQNHIESVHLVQQAWVRLLGFFFSSLDLFTSEGFVFQFSKRGDQASIIYPRKSSCFSSGN